MDITEKVKEYLEEVCERAFEQLEDGTNRKWQIYSCTRAEMYGVVMFAQRVGGKYSELKPIADAAEEAVFKAFLNY